MSNLLKLEIVTPEAMTYSDEVEMVTLPGVEGEMGIFPMHVPLMTQIVAGEVLVRKDGREHSFAVGDGFAEISSERVAILTDMAVDEDNIDETRAEEARRQAEVRLKEEHLSDEELATVNAAMAHSLALLKVKRRHSR